MPPEVPVSQGSNFVEKLPGVFSLIRSGLALYKERSATLITLGFLNFLLTYIAAGTFTFLAIFVTSGKASLGLIIGGALIVLVGLPLFAWLWGWFSLALFYVLLGAKEHTGFFEALRQARARTLSFIWLLVLKPLVLFGAVALLIFLIMGFSIVGGGFVVLAVLAGVIGFVILFPVFWTWFGFAEWALVDLGTRGTAALLASRSIVGRNFFPILWRTIAIGFLVGLVAILVSFLSSWLASLLIPVIKKLSLGIISIGQLFDMVVVYPIMTAMFLVLYQAAKERLGLIETRKGKGVLVALATVGVVSLFAVPAALFLFFGPLFASLNVGTGAPQGVGSVSGSKAVQLAGSSSSQKTTVLVSQPSDWKTYTDTADGFSFSYPNIGQVATANIPPSLAVVVPNGDTMGVYVIDAVFNQNNIQDSVGRVIDAYLTTVGGKLAYEYTRSAQGCSSRTVQMALGQRTLMISFGTCDKNPPPHFDESTQNRIISSVVFTK